MAQVLNFQLSEQTLFLVGEQGMGGQHLQDTAQVLFVLFQTLTIHQYIIKKKPAQTFSNNP